MPSPTLLVKGSLVLANEAKMAKANRDLPVNYIISWIKNRMPEFGHNKANLEDRILVVRAETGSGKSTVLPVEVFRILRSKTTPLSERYIGKNVICTQPRVLTAIALANDVSGRAWNPDIILGKTVGYQTGPSSNKPTAGLLFATAGVLSVQLENQSDADIMSMYKFILVDEAHERSQDCDLMLMYLKNFYIRNKGNKDLPFLLLTSATFDIKRYATYFDISLDNTVEVIGRAYPIYEHWPKYDIINYVDESVIKAIQIHEENIDDSNDKCDILIFAPGMKHIETIKTQLEEKNEIYCEPNSKHNPFLILVINRENINSQADDFNIMFIKPHLLPKIKGKIVKRRIIIATIVAETGLTVDTLKYVIECGWNKSDESYQPYEISGLITRPAPKSKIKQRKGRAGRMFPGEFYPLYTQASYELLDEQQLPDFITGGIKKKYLAIVKEQQKQKILMQQFPDFRIEDVTLLDPPPMESFIMANSSAALLGFIAENAPLPKQWPPNLSDENLFNIETGFGLTKLGHIASNINSISIESIRMILLSYIYDIAIEDMINIAAIMTVDNIFNIEERKKKHEPCGIDILFSSIPHYKKIINYINTKKNRPEIEQIEGEDQFSGGKKKKKKKLTNAVAAAAPAPNVEKNMEKELEYITIKLLISDNYIEHLLMFEYFIEELNTFHKKHGGADDAADNPFEKHPFEKRADPKIEYPKNDAAEDAAAEDASDDAADNPFEKHPFEKRADPKIEYPKNDAAEDAAAEDASDDAADNPFETDKFNKLNFPLYPKNDAADDAAIDDAAIDDAAAEDAAEDASIDVRDVIPIDDAAAIDAAAASAESDFFTENLKYFVDIEESSFQNWCKSIGFEYSTMIAALSKRNEIIDELYSVGIDPYNNGSFKLKNILNDYDGGSVQFLINTIKEIKSCIYGGYYNNLLKLNETDNSYYNNQNIKIKLHEPFIKAAMLKSHNFAEYKPKWIISNLLTLNQVSSTDLEKPAPLLYQIEANKISILDGFIYPDFDRYLPKIDVFD